jgi:hypothetical protein
MRRVIARLPGGVLIESIVAPVAEGELQHRYHVSGGRAGEHDFDTLTALNEYVIALNSRHCA